ncbi:hypothetical protein QJS04_geneDACA015993 [Acorus gramineus]|uniref:Uncharacterized protein n=1 Tax=Acorus gramineus TaxID=55184 RepID=A0AAV9BEY0_ACOGR|nr:hypothetical protein QJS04_geneDACA015993 [Acorus gramineus]
MDLSGNKFSKAGSSRSRCSRLTELNLSRNSVLGGIHLFTASLRQLDLSQNCIGPPQLHNLQLSDHDPPQPLLQQALRRPPNLSQCANLAFTCFSISKSRSSISHCVSSSPCGG